MPAPTEPGTDIVVAVTQNPGLVLLDRVKFDAWYEKLSAEAPTDADVTTNKGRDALRSFAAKVRSEKAQIDKARLGLTREWRDLTSQANAAGKEIEERLEGLAIEVRAPLTEWEEAEKARVAECQAAIDGMRAYKVIAEDDSAASVRERGTAVYNMPLDPDRFGAMLGEAEAAKADAIDTLKRALARMVQEEADREELARLRAEKEEADRLNAEADAAAEAERQRVEEARIAEERRVEAEKADAERIERAKAEAAEAAQRAAEQAAQAERERVQSEHYAALTAERERAEKVEREAQDDRDRIEAARVAAETEAKRIAAEDAARAKNRAHRAQFMGEAKLSIMAAGNVDEAAAVAIVKAIVAGSIPHVSLEF